MFPIWGYQQLVVCVGKEFMLDIDPSKNAQRLTASTGLFLTSRIYAHLLPQQSIYWK